MGLKSHKDHWAVPLFILSALDVLIGLLIILLATAFAPDAVTVGDDPTRRPLCESLLQSVCDHTEGAPFGHRIGIAGIAFGVVNMLSGFFLAWCTRSARSPNLWYGVMAMACILAFGFVGLVGYMIFGRHRTMSAIWGYVALACGISGCSFCKFCLSVTMAESVVEENEKIAVKVEQSTGFADSSQGGWQQPQNYYDPYAAQPQPNYGTQPQPGYGAPGYAY